MATNNSGDIPTGAVSTVLQGAGVGSNPTFTATPTVTSVTFGSGTALNTYQQGTFTPTITFGGASVGITYTTQHGEYSQIGNTVYYIINIVLSSKGSSTGAAVVNSFPVAISTTNGQPYVVIGSSASLTFTGIAVLKPGNSSTTSADLQQNNSGTLSALADTAFANTTAFTVIGFYFTS